eukprot:gene50454-12264_t
MPGAWVAAPSSPSRATDDSKGGKAPSPRAAVAPPAAPAPAAVAHRRGASAPSATTRTVSANDEASARDDGSDHHVADAPGALHPQTHGVDINQGPAIPHREEEDEGWEGRAEEQREAGEGGGRHAAGAAADWCDDGDPQRPFTAVGHIALNDPDEYEESGEDEAVVAPGEECVLSLAQPAGRELPWGVNGRAVSTPQELAGALSGQHAVDIVLRQPTAEDLWPRRAAKRREAHGDELCIARAFLLHCRAAEAAAAAMAARRRRGPAGRGSE